MTTVEVSEIDSAPPLRYYDEAYDYAVLTELGKQAVEQMDRNRWRLGDYTRLLITYFTRYNHGDVKQFAEDISIDPGRLYEFSGMASFYPPEVREEFSELNLSYSHWREARRLKELDKAIEFLKVIALNAWTLNQTRQALSVLKRGGEIDVSRTYGEDNKIIDLHGNPIDQRPIYQWRGPALVEVDKQGVVHIRCDHTPEIEPNKRYIVSFEEIED
jgi:hypothetical protein